MSRDVIPKLLESRQEYWIPEQSRFAGQQLLSPLGHLFKGHKIPTLDEEGFRLSSNDKDAIHVRTAAYIFEESGNKTIRRRLEPEQIESWSIPLEELYIISESGDSSSIVVSLDADAADLKRLERFGNRRKNAISGQDVDIPKYQFVSARGISDQESSTLWDSISLTDLEEEVLKGLRIIEPALVRLTFIKTDPHGSHYLLKENYPDRIPIIRPDETSDPVPLKSLGDGMIRIFHITLSLVSAKGGMLLIDEFENGLHWEVQEKAWRVVFELAEKLDVQVFATTHSRDCISSFSKVWQENPKIRGIHQDHKGA
uniref:AAA domain-containing protein, putative AbiEii toxin, Type IV TA system n=1 Tax=Candidatus Kentrum eta TaxID=2126337 RepID=A0A450V9V4_9GAMM|nr:MAG: AAA domain-containing protein, putative AbiEii toxin, Type IV TA system [Candidatus Kentron sp. H]VFJ95477.1 MAG: AAA domain-containing protein, putative AbiEii toxin, Type IV TA system [Candidatus Kentron sp. H]VFK01556.1 MAG: AAA domain-containing protein, putative AbiEii toxin, Type IV TA system [Candidatus Kentron sp. H]